MSCFRLSGDRIYLDIKAAPGASKSQLAEITEGRLRVRIAAAPEDGRANAELCAFLAKLLDCPKKDLILQSGEKSRLKTLALPAAYRDKLCQLLQDLAFCPNQYE
ncbi:MAG: DUF167 domain-containing protein [Treponema sp.]|jgi:uncharacterized protein (TIGR00251 family)|nr:DUF167 domain-containing protein [Treponema sp.]